MTYSIMTEPVIDLFLSHFFLLKDQVLTWTICRHAKEKLINNNEYPCELFGTQDVAEFFKQFPNDKRLKERFLGE
jgi:hypothetical protein